MHKTVLLITDNQPIFRAGVRKAIAQEEGLENLEILDCDPGSEGEEAIRWIVDHSPDVLILDVQSPVLNGLAFVRHITNNFTATKVIALSANYNAGELIEVAEAGAAAYMTRDSSAKELVSAMKQAVSGEYPINDLLKNSSTIQAEEVKEFVETGSTKPASEIDKFDTIAPLTLKETEFLNLLAEDRSYKQIAAILGLRHEDVKSCVNVILKKLNASNKAHTIMLELCKNWLSLQENEEISQDIRDVVSSEVDVKKNGPTKRSSKKDTNTPRRSSKKSSKSSAKSH